MSLSQVSQYIKEHTFAKHVPIFLVVFLDLSSSPSFTAFGVLLSRDMFTTHVYHTTTTGLRPLPPPRDPTSSLPWNVKESFSHLRIPAVVFGAGGLIPKPLNSLSERTNMAQSPKQPHVFLDYS